MDCDICNKRIKYKKNWIRHINSKAHIKKSIQQASAPEISGFGEKVLPSAPKCSQMLPNIKPEKKRYQCEFCLTSIGRSNNLNKHLKICKKKAESDAKDAEIAELKKLLSQQNGGNTTNNTTNNINNNDNRVNNNTINLNVYGQEAIIFTEDFLWELQHESLTDVERCKMIMEKVFIETEQNRTLMITNLRTNLGKIFLGTDWKAANTQQMIEGRINRLPITYKKGATQCINNMVDADETYKKEQLSIHNNLSQQIKDNTLTNDKKVKEISEAHKIDAYNYH